MMPYLLLIVGMSYTEDTSYGLYVLEKKLGLIVLPFILFINHDLLSKQFVSKLLTFFAFGCLFFGLSLNIYLIIRIISYTSSHQWTGTLYDFISQENFTDIYRSELTRVSLTHTTYLGIYFSLSAVFIYHNLLSKFKKGTKSFIFIIAILLLTIFTITTGARTPFLALLLAFLLLTILLIKSKALKFTFISSIIVVAMGLVILVPQIRSRMTEVYKTTYSLESLKEHNSSNVRYAILYSVRNILKENWLFGLGTGDTQSALNKEYEKIGAPILIEKKYNSHNEFLDNWMSTGVIGISSLLFLLISCLNYSISNKDYLFFSFLLMMIIFFITENVLSRQDGLVTFAFFTPLFRFIINSPESTSQKN